MQFLSGRDKNQECRHEREDDWSRMVTELPCIALHDSHLRLILRRIILSSGKENRHAQLGHHPSANP